MSNWDLGAGLCLALHLTEINTEVSIPLNPVLPCVMGKWDCCIANWCSLVNCREETGEAGIRRGTEPGLNIQIWKRRVPDPRSWLYYSKLQQRVRTGLLSQFWGWADLWRVRTGISTREWMHSGCVKSSTISPRTIPFMGYLMKVFAAITKVAAGTSTDRLGKQTVQWC